MKILEFLTGFISAFDNPLYDYFLGGVLVTLAGSVAYWIGGKLGYSGKIGFWLWLLTAVVVYAVIACIIRFVMWLISIPWWVWLIITGTLSTVIIIGIVYGRRKAK